MSQGRLILKVHPRAEAVSPHRASSATSPSGRLLVGTIRNSGMAILAVDVGGTHVKVLVSNQTEARRFASSPELTAAMMVAGVKQLTTDWQYDVVSLGYPGPVVHGAPFCEPAHLGPGWVGFDFDAAFGCPAKVINDAAMQAVGSYHGGRMLFLGLGTGLGSAMVADGVVEPMELAHLPYKQKKTFEDFVGQRALERLGKKAWRGEVETVLAKLAAGLRADYVVLGGGNVKWLKELPAGTQLGNNDNAFTGGFRLWAAPETASEAAPPQQRVRGDIRFFDAPEDVQRAAAELIVQQAQDAVAARGRFTIALSGGSTPRGLFTLLAHDDDWRRRLPWQSVHFYWGDERHVPPDHPDSSFRMAKETLLSVIPVAEANVHRVHAEQADAAEAATAYEAELRRTFGLAQTELPRFDCILLGLGPEGHTASLFPGTRALTETTHLVVSNWVAKLFTERITFTPPLINNAALVLFLVTGERKALALKSVLDGPYEPDQLPAQLIQPCDGRLVWLLDRSAAALIARSESPN
jgi:6-phosphogluconolactonase